MKFLHKTPIQIRFNDIDRMNHVNNSIYQNYFDLARTEYFNAVFEEKINWQEKAMVLAKITIEYINPILIDEEVIVRSKIYKLGNKSLQMQQEIVNKTTLEIKAKNDAVLVAFGLKENAAIDLPENWKNDIIKFEKDIKF